MPVITQQPPDEDLGIEQQRLRPASGLEQTLRLVLTRWAERSFAGQTGLGSELLGERSEAPKPRALIAGDKPHLGPAMTGEITSSPDSAALTSFESWLLASSLLTFIPIPGSIWPAWPDFGCCLPMAPGR